MDPYAGSFARRIVVRPGERALDLGCGSGVYGVALARRGARVTLADLDPRAVRAALARARRAGVRRRVEGRAGDLFAAVAGERFDLVVAVLPQCPGPRGLTPTRWGGPDGTRILLRCVRAAPRHLRPGGRLFLLLTDLAHPRRVLATLRRRFSVRRIARTGRAVTRREFDALHPGLFDHLLRCCRAGTARLAGRGDRRRLGVSLFEARLRPGRTRARTPRPR